MNPNYDKQTVLTALVDQISTQVAKGSLPPLESFTLQYPDLKEEITQIYWKELASIDSDSGGSIDTSAALDHVRRLAEVSRSKATNLTERVRELGISPRAVAQEVNLPSELITQLQRRCVTELPEKLIIRLARALKQPTPFVPPLVSAVEPEAKMATHHRANGEPTSTLQKLCSFEEALRELEKRGKLDDSQRREWLENRV